MAASSVGPAPAKTVHPDFQLLRGEVQQYGDWLAGCDNRANCTLIGVPQAPACSLSKCLAIDMAVRIGFPADPAQPPGVTLIPLPTGTARAASFGEASWRFRLRGGDQNFGPPHHIERIELDPEESALVLFWLEKGLAIDDQISMTRGPSLRFASRNYRTAARALRSRQISLRKELAGQAIENLPGEPPDGTVMPSPPALPRRIKAEPIMVSGFVPIDPRLTCADRPMSGLSAYRVGGRWTMWRYHCSGEDEAQRSLWFWSGGAEMAVPLELPEPREGKVEAGIKGLPGATFDFDFGILRSYQYQSEGQDCGTFRAWAITEQGWHLIARDEMPLCRGLAAEDWIRTFQQPSQPVE